MNDVKASLALIGYDDRFLVVRRRGEVEWQPPGGKLEDADDKQTHREDDAEDEVEEGQHKHNNTDRSRRRKRARKNRRKNNSGK